MRILSVVTLITPTSEYGGPVRVAVNQARALRERGHEVLLTAAARGYGRDMPREIEGVPAQLFPARSIVPGTGFAGLAAPGLAAWLRRGVLQFDVAHVHVARDLVTLPAANFMRRRGVPYVLQPHGMIDRSSNPLAAPLDRALTLPLMRGAGRVLHLTDRERTDLLGLGVPEELLAELGNGVPAYSRETSDGPPEVLFLARLAARKRPLAFVEMARRLADLYPSATFRVVGPDEGEGVAVERAIDAAGLGDRLRWEGPVAPEASVQRMASAGVYVLPAVDEPYPMAVLEAASLGLPVVVTRSCGLARFVEQADAGAVVDESVEALTDAVGALLSDTAVRRATGARGAEAVRRSMSMSAVAERLEDEYRLAMARVRGSST